MISCTRPQRLSRLLAGAALVTMTALSQSSVALAEQGRSIVIAQAAPADNAPAEKKPPTPQQQQRQEQRRQDRIQERAQERAPTGQPAQPPAAQQQQQQPHTAPTAQQPRPQAPATAQQPQSAPAPTAQEQRREERRDQRRQGQPAQAPAAQQPAPQAPAAQQQQPQAPATQAPATQAPATAQQPRPQAPATAQQPPSAPAPTAQEQRREERRDQRRPGQPQPAPTAQQPTPQAPATAQQPRPQAPATAQQPAPQAPTAQQPAPAVVQRNPAAIAPPTQPRDAREFIRRDAQGPAPKIDDLRKNRQEVREGDRTIIREGDRTIVRENNTTIIRHSETNRFVINAANVRTEQRGGNLETIVQRNGGYSIVNITDANGQLIRRVRRDPRGRDIVIIDNSFIGVRPAPMFVQLAPPVIGIPRERYIVEMGRARPDDIYGVFLAPPVEPLAERYTLDQVRFNAPLRDRMPRVDLDINFETSSWQLGPEQIDKLSVIADGINRALQRNPREVFMVEGYTDATGSPEDNLSLSDRRAESVAVALTEQFNVPPENLVTQGYGAQFLKINTPGPEEANRRVAVRRITPLIDGPQASNATR